VILARGVNPGGWGSQSPDFGQGDGGGRREVVGVADGS